MADYTTSRTSTMGGIGIFVAAAIVVLVLLYALFAGGSDSTTADPTAIGAPDTAPITESAAPTAPAVPTE